MSIVAITVSAIGGPWNVPNGGNWPQIAIALFVIPGLTRDPA